MENILVAIMIAGIAVLPLAAFRYWLIGVMEENK